MKLLNKTQIIFIFSAVLFITAIILFSNNYEPIEVEKPAEKTIYQPTKISDLPYLSEQYLNYLLAGRNPFVSSIQKIPNEADIELPPIIIKKPAYNLWTPLPDSAYYNALVYTIPIDKPEYRHSINQFEQSDLPNLNKLPSLEKIRQLIDTTTLNSTKEVKKIPDAPLDCIYFMDNTSSKGKVLMEDNEKVIFQEEGKKYFVSYPKSKIRKIERVYSLEEQYTRRTKEINPNDALAHYELARWCISQELLNHALTELEQAIKLNKTLVDIYLLAGDLYRQQTDLNNELKIYQQAIGSPVLRKEIFYLRLGNLYGLLGRNEESIEAFKAAIQIAPNNSFAWLKLSYTYFQAGDYKLTEDNYKKASQIAPLDAGVMTLEGLLLFKRGTLSQAQSVLTKVLDKILADKQTISIMDKDEIYAILGVINVLTKDYSSASNYFVMAIQSHPYKATHWVNLSSLYLVGEGIEISNLLLEEASKRDPSSSLPYLAQGYLIWSQDKIDEAVQKFQEAAKIEPTNPLVLYAQGQAHFTKDELTEATQVFSALLKKKPLIKDCLYYLGVIAFQGNKFSDSAAYFKLYMEKLVNKPLLSDYAMLGIVNLSLNQWDTARSYFEQALNINPQFAPTLNGLAYLEYKTNHSAKAIAHFSNVLKWYQDDLYAANSLKAINEAKSQVIWRDLFNRPYSTTVGEGWTEKEPFGIEIELINEDVHFGGTQLIQDNGITYLERPINQDNFVLFEADLAIKGINRAGIGIYLASKEERTKGVVFYGLIPSDINYKLSWQFSNSPDNILSKWNEIPDVFFSTDYVKLGIQKVIGNNNQPELKLYLNNKQVGTISLSQLRFLMNTKTCVLGIFGYAPVGARWELSGKTVRVIEKK